MFELGGKIALVTGAGGAGAGTGAGIARAMARQGAHVAVNDIQPGAAAETVRIIMAAGGAATSVPFDVTDAGAVDDAVQRVTMQIGPVDILVNNAGGGGVGQFREMAPADWERVVALNLFGTVYCTRAVVPSMCERGWGRIVSVASGAADVGLAMGVTAYGAAKAGITGFMRHLSQELGPFGVTANSVAPGAIGDVYDRLAAEPGPSSPRVGTPVGRGGTPDDIGALCVYLASEEAGWVTGQTIHINGGSYTT